MKPPASNNSLVSLLFLWILSTAAAQPYIGVNYGEVADNLPPPATTAQLLGNTTISKVRLYGADPAIIRALAGTGISIVIGADNGDIPSLAGDPAAASRWVAANVAPFFPASSISAVSVGNEVLSYGDETLKSQLVGAMENLRSALPAAVKVTTVHSMAVLGQSDPPSSGAFQTDLLENLKGILGFLNATRSPFMINPYPFFAYRSDPRPETLAFCLFQPNSGRFDSGTKITYTNMFDAQVDAVRAALTAAGSADVEVVVAETGWPYRGDPDELGTSVENAKAYNGGLVAHLRSGSGTPSRPGEAVETYIFALYDEDLKPGPLSERSFGLYRPDLTPTYDIGILRSPASAAGGEGPSPAASGGEWCVAAEGATEEEMQEDLDYACGVAGVDCGPIQRGGACFEPDTVRSHAAYAMNALYQSFGRHPWNCDFRGSAALTSTNPSYGGCVYGS